MALTKSQVIPRAKLTASRPAVELLLGLGIWCIGLLSTAIAFSGGWSVVMPVAPGNVFDALWAIVSFQLVIPTQQLLFALASQLALSYWQWTSAHSRDWQFFVPRLIDAFINWLFLNPLFQATIAGALTAIGTPAEWAGYLAMAINFALGWLVAYIPENTLVDG